MKKLLVLVVVFLVCDRFIIYKISKTHEALAQAEQVAEKKNKYIDGLKIASGMIKKFQPR